jgi:type IV secretion system protein VirB1
MIAVALLACALNVAPATMDAVIRVEHGSPTAINVNKLAGPQPKASTVQEAVAITKRYMAAGYTVDMGWSQLNSANLVRLGYTVEDAFDQCKNIAAGGMILSGFYGKAVQQYGEGQIALAHALSAYNTGDLQRRGFENGYVGRYFISAPLTLPDQSPAPLPPRIANALTWPAPQQVASMQVYVRPGLSLSSN